MWQNRSNHFSLVACVEVLLPTCNFVFVEVGKSLIPRALLAPILLLLIQRVYFKCSMRIRELKPNRKRR